MAWTSPTTRATGELITASIWNTDLTNNLLWVGAAAGVGTSLPGSPINGHRFVYTNSLTAPTYHWVLVYNSTTGKWHYLGGTPLFAEVTASESTSSASYTSTGFTALAITLPRAGDYDVEIGFTPTAGNNVAGSMSYDIGATAAVDADRATGAFETSGNDIPPSVSRPRRKTGLSAVTLTAKYKSNDGAISIGFSNRWMRVTPVELG